jgi:hypothetical protein
MKMLKSALKLSNLLKLFAYSSLIGLSSCTSTFIVNDKNPSPSYLLWNSEPGLDIWSIERADNYTYESNEPEWCHKQQAWVDGNYYELECYFKTRKDVSVPSNYSTYRVDRFRYSENENGIYSLNFDMSEKKSISNDEAGKWRRFFGEEDLLPIENTLQQINIFLFIVAFCG